MRTILYGGLVAILMTTQAAAQAATIGVFPPGTLDAGGAIPIRQPVTYTPSCGQPVSPEASGPLVNPRFGAYDDPAVMNRECRLDVSAQFAELPPGTNYRAAVKVGQNPYGPLSMAFAVAAQAVHPCDGAPSATGTVIEGTRTISWCFDGRDTNGATTTVPNWAVYVNATRLVVPAASVTVGGTVNAAGMRLYSTPVALTRGTSTLRVAAVNAVGEATPSATFTVTVQPPPAVPTTSVIRGVN